MTETMNWEDSFRSWASAPGQTEQTKCDNAVNAIQRAIDASPALQNKSVRVFGQGSYKNRTNVRQDSDVDVCVLCSVSMFFDLPAGMTPANFNIKVPADYGYDQFKNDVEAALTSHFRNGHIVRGNKAFDIRENTYRIAADAVPCFLYRNFYRNGAFGEGVAFVPDIGPRVTNFPEHNYANGVLKNTATGQRFKDVVRIFKRLRYKMQDENVAAAEPIPSFLLECLVYNVPNEILQRQTYTTAVRESLVHLYTSTQDAQSCAAWKEENERKMLFGNAQPWTCAQVNAFVSEAWSYLGFG